jgi:hypothetical protein
VFFGCCPRKYSSTLTPIFAFHPQHIASKMAQFLVATLDNSRTHGPVFSVLPLTLRLHTEEIFGRHTRHFACTLTQFFGCHLVLRLNTDFDFCVLPSTLRLHTDAICWVQPTTLSLHTDGNFCCRPSHFACTLTQNLSATLDTSRAY